MKKVFGLFLVLGLISTLLLAIQINVSAGTSGIYVYGVTDGKAIITKCSTTASGDITIPSTLDGYPVTIIGSKAFENCTDISSVTLPDNITTIGYSAFSGCTSLINITIPDSVLAISDNAFYNTAWYNNKPDGVVYAGKVAYRYKFSEPTKPNFFSVKLDSDTLAIADKAFYGEEVITEIIIPKSVTRIGDRSFVYCRALTDIIVDIDNSYYSSDYGVLFNKNKASVLAYPMKKSNAVYTIPCSVVNIEKYAFYNSANLTDINITKNVTSIGEMAFVYGQKLTSIAVDANNPNYTSEDGVLFSKDKTNLIQYPSKNANFSYVLPSSVKTIADSSFSSSYALTSVTIPNGVTNIGTSAFSNCSNLKSIIIPSSITSIGVYAFYGCSKLVIYGYDGSYAQTYAQNNSIPFNVIFTYTILDNKVTITACSETISGALEIPSTLGGYPVTHIGSYAFSACDSLTSVTIPSSVTGIASWAFSNCTGLKSVRLPDDITSIPSYVFPYCTSLTSINIPNSVTSIGEGAFLYCTSLTSITIPNSVINIGEWAFSYSTGLINDNPNLTIYGYAKSYVKSYAQNNNLKFTAISEYITVESVNLNKNSITLMQDLTELLTSTISPVNATDQEVSWSSDNESVATVSQTGLVTAIGIGTTKITVTSKDGSKTADCNISVRNVSDILTYTVSNNQAIITRCVNDFSGSLEIPTTIGRYLVKSIGDNAFSDCSNLVDITIPNSVTGIGNNAFRDCRELTSIIIPNSVTSIGEGAFSGCSNLITITIPDSVTSIPGFIFYNCSSLTNIIIPDSITSIDKGAFEGTPWLDNYPNDFVIEGKNILIKYKGNQQNVTISNTVTSIASGAFSGNESVDSVIIPNSISEIGDWAFGDCKALIQISIPSSVMSIGEYAFEGTPWLNNYPNDFVIEGNNILIKYNGNQQNVTIPSSVTAIAGGAFSGCSSLENVVLPDDITSIGDWAFAFCSSLSQIIIPNKVERIGHVAFVGCSSLSQLIIPDSVTSIGRGTFSGCSGLTEIRLSNNLKSIGNDAFTACGGLTEVTIPDKVESIGNSTFYNCRGLVKITIPYSVLKIGAMAFSECSSLTSINIPSSVTSIGGGAFWGCTSLTSITIPNSITTIEQHTFYYCPNLISIIIPESVTSIDYYAFEGSNNVVLYVYKNSYAESFAIDRNIQYEILPSPVWKILSVRKNENILTVQLQKGEFSEETTLFLAFYENGRTVRTMTQSVSSADEYVFDITNYRAGQTIKAFLWKKGSIRPLATPKQFPILEILINDTNIIKATLGSLTYIDENAVQNTIFFSSAVSVYLNNIVLDTYTYNMLLESQTVRCVDLNADGIFDEIYLTKQDIINNGSNPLITGDMIFDALAKGSTIQGITFDIGVGGALTKITIDSPDITIANLNLDNVALVVNAADVAIQNVTATNPPAGTPVITLNANADNTTISGFSFTEVGAAVGSAITVAAGVTGTAITDSVVANNDTTITYGSYEATNVEINIYDAAPVPPIVVSNSATETNVVLNIRKVVSPTGKIKAVVYLTGIDTDKDIDLGHAVIGYTLKTLTPDMVNAITTASTAFEIVSIPSTSPGILEVAYSRKHGVSAGTPTIVNIDGIDTPVLDLFSIDFALPATVAVGDVCSVWLSKTSPNNSIIRAVERFFAEGSEWIPLPMLYNISSKYLLETVAQY